MKIAWLLVNCNSIREADRIGKELLRQRYIACYDIIARQKAAYFWPPKSGKIEKAKGAMVILVTMPKQTSGARKMIAQLHGDTLPSINGLSVEVSTTYGQWVKGVATHAYK